MGPAIRQKQGLLGLVEQPFSDIQYLRLSKGAEMVAMADYLPYAALNIGLLKDYYSEECIKATVKIVILFESFIIENFKNAVTLFWQKLLASKVSPRFNATYGKGEKRQLTCTEDNSDKFFSYVLSKAWFPKH